MIFEKCFDHESFIHEIVLFPHQDITFINVKWKIHEPELVVRRGSIKVSAQENASVGLRLVTLIKKDSNTGVFL